MFAVLSGILFTGLGLGVWCGFTLGGVVGYLLAVIDIVTILMLLISSAYMAGKKATEKKITGFAKTLMKNYDPFHDTTKEVKPDEPERNH